ncbi:MAG: SRPBCC domain-containing protein [Bacteroidia bacterium]|nr:SRPBCC domain-containing protein [Bacteroidia bacterium]
MAFEINTSIRIEATPSQIWTVFSDFSNYKEWNQFIHSIEGEIVEGQRFKATVGNMNFKPTVLTYEPNKKFEWIGRLLLPGIFDGRHVFELMDNGDGSTTFVQKEYFNGILVPVFRKKLDTEVRGEFEKMNAALKHRVESMK